MTQFCDLLHLILNTAIVPATRGHICKLQYIKLHNNLEVRYNALWLLHVRPATQPTVTVVAICHEMLVIPTKQYPLISDNPFGPILQ